MREGVSWGRPRDAEAEKGDVEGVKFGGGEDVGVKEVAKSVQCLKEGGLAFEERVKGEKGPKRGELTSNNAIVVKALHDLIIQLYSYSFSGLVEDY